MFTEPKTMVYKRQKGFSAVEAIVILVIVAALGLAGYFVFSRQQKNGSADQTSTKTSSQDQSSVQWSWTGSLWEANGTVPACPNPLLKTPVDVSQVTSVLYPGQSRGGNYKAHGGFRFDNNSDNNVNVKAPMDAVVVRGSRYIESGETQYLFEFINSCGIKYRLDHLLVLSAKLQSLAEKLPAAMPDDSRTTDLSGTTVSAGEVIATAVGFSRTKNVGVDFGVYDLRSSNEVSKNSSWDAAHPDKEADAYGVCWLDLLSEPDKTTVKSLPAGDQTSGAKSDYCK